MQATAAEIQRLKNRRDEDAINFRPSPNFKHMKKYLKFKFDEANASGASEQGSGEDEERVNGTSANMLQPPLPPNPPPPDSPLTITLKEEVQDDEYQTGFEPKNPPESVVRPNVYVPTTSASQKEKVMCRQFARGACTRGASCIYVHEIILDQLPGIYTFCKNFQNSGCNFPRCKFVHATVFEKECFYRTGFLPPHSLAHLKENAATQPSPAGPEGGPPGGPAGGPPVFANPPPPVLLPGMSVPGGAAERPPEPSPAAAAPAPSSAPAPAPASAVKLGAAARDSDAGEPLSKKCKNCDLNEFRLQCNKSKVEKLMRSTEEIDKKMSQLSKKNSKLYTVVISLLRNSSVKTPGANHLSNRNDKEKAMMEKLNMLFSGNNRHSLVDDDNNTKNMSTVLVRLLLSTGESAAGDGS